MLDPIMASQLCFIKSFEIAQLAREGKGCCFASVLCLHVLPKTFPVRCLVLAKCTIKEKT